MADNTIITQGSFVSDGNRKVLSIRSDLDWMYVYNMTALTQAAGNLGSTFYWQRGMTPGSGVVYTKLGAVANDPLTIGALAAGTGFTLVDQGYSSGISSQVRNSDQVSAPVAFTATSNATRPVISTADTSGLQVGDIVRLSQAAGAIDADDLLGIDFQIDAITANVNFRIANALQQAPGAGGTNGFWRRVTVPNTFYPEWRYVVNIATAGAFGTLTATVLAPVVVTSVDSGYLVGQEVTFNVPSVLNGMTQINTLSAPIIAVDPATPSVFQVRLDTTGFTPFVFPTIAQVAADGPYTPATVVPAGMNTAEALAAVPVVNILSDATVNQAIIGMQLSGGAAAGLNAGPAGADGDQMFWVAGKSFSVNNE
ncbi:hypothetical protein [Methylobacter sp.]|uniref:hypothetical protein n=1 Tax=Methylobacter sp. TaxID=2051955 RepID=UPI003DA34905